MNAYIKIRAALEWGEGPIFVEALAALAELERAAAQPVAYQYAHPYFGGGKIWREEQRWNGHTSDEARALYAALPAPVAEIREPVEVDDEIARKLWREWFDAGCMTGLDTARFWLRVWQRELGPTLGMVPPDARADARIAELERERNSLRDFANSVMDSWPHGDVDGAYLERMAVEHGLLALKYPRPTEPCGDNCACSGYPTPEEWAEGIDCYVRTPLLTGAEARAGNGGEG